MQPVWDGVVYRPGHRDCGSESTLPLIPIGPARASDNAAELDHVRGRVGGSGRWQAQPLFFRRIDDDDHAGGRTLVAGIPGKAQPLDSLRLIDSLIFAEEGPEKIP